MTFQLDKLGCVARLPTEDGHADGWVSWSDLSPFEQGYVEALFASQPEGALHVDRDTGAEFYRFSDLHPEALARIREDCRARFEGWVIHPNNSYVRQDDKTEGQRFWRDRQAGQCSAFPPLHPYLDDTGRVCLREGV